MALEKFGLKQAQFYCNVIFGLGVIFWGIKK